MRYIVVTDNDANRIEVNSAEGLQAHFFKKHFTENLNMILSPSVARGELLPQGHTGLKISYDLNEGSVTLESHDPRPGIFQNFSSDAFHDYFQPIILAIQWLSKLTLIHHIYSLGDADLDKLIERAGMIDPLSKKVNSDISLDKIDSLLMAICKSVDPKGSGVQQVMYFFRPEDRDNLMAETKLAIHDVFLELGIDRYTIIDKVTSLNYVQECCDKMDSLRQNRLIMS